jgi:hypothetical protein
MKEPTAADFDHAHDLAKNWQPDPEITPQQHADAMLAFWQSRRYRPPAERLPDESAPDDESVTRDMAVRDLLSATDTLMAFAVAPPADPKLTDYLDALELAHARISTIIQRITRG